MYDNSEIVIFFAAVIRCDTAAGKIYLPTPLSFTNTSIIVDTTTTTHILEPWVKILLGAASGVLAALLLSCCVLCRCCEAEHKEQGSEAVSSTFQEDGTEAKYDFLYISREDLIHLQKREEGNSGHVHIDADIS